MKSLHAGLNPNSHLFFGCIGHLMTLLGDWTLGLALIRKVIRLNSFYNPVVHYALWLDLIRQEEYEWAHLGTLNSRLSSVFWDSLAKAAILGHLRRYKEGKQAVEDLLKLKSYFLGRGRILTIHYIKFKDIAERVIGGMRKLFLINILSGLMTVGEKRAS